MLRLECPMLGAQRIVRGTDAFGSSVVLTLQLLVLALSGPAGTHHDRQQRNTSSGGSGKHL